MMNVAILMAGLFLPSLTFAASEFKGVDWLKKNRDQDGCIPLVRLSDEEKLDACPREFSPQIRPQIVGTLDRKKTDAKSKDGDRLCCFSWQVHGNR